MLTKVYTLNWTSLKVLLDSSFVLWNGLERPEGAGMMALVRRHVAFCFQVIIQVKNTPAVWGKIAVFLGDRQCNPNPSDAFQSPVKAVVLEARTFSWDYTKSLISLQQQKGGWIPTAELTSMLF